MQLPLMGSGRKWGIRVKGIAHAVVKAASRVAKPIRGCATSSHFPLTGRGRVGFMAPWFPAF